MIAVEKAGNTFADKGSGPVFLLGHNTDYRLNQGLGTKALDCTAVLPKVRDVFLFESLLMNLNLTEVNAAIEHLIKIYTLTLKMLYSIENITTYIENT